MRASSPSRTAKAAHVTSNDRQDKMKAMKMMNAMDTQNSGSNRILNRRPPFVRGEKFAIRRALSIIHIYGRTSHNGFSGINLYQSWNRCPLRR